VALVVGFEQMNPGALGSYFNDRPLPVDVFLQRCDDLLGKQEIPPALRIFGGAGLDHMRVGDGYVLDGVKTLVLGGVDADAFIVSARMAGSCDSDGISLFLVEAGAKGLSRQPMPLHDGSWAAEVTLDRVRIGADCLLGEPGHGLAALRQGPAHGTAALCAELVGAMEKAVEMTSEYLKVRKQFGVSIGSFQALQHRMADMAAELELARSMLFRHATILQNGRGRLWQQRPTADTPFEALRSPWGTARSKLRGP